MTKPKKTTEETLTVWRKRYPVILLLAFLASAAGYTARPLWFDEVLTMDWTVYSLAEIPFQYIIPNNHIFYSLCLKTWKLLTECLSLYGTLYLRVLSLVFGAITVLLLYKRLKRSGGPAAALICTLLFAVALPMQQYGTALRGYMPGFLFTFCAFLTAENWLRSDRKKYFWLYLLSCFLAVGTMPSNLLFLWTAGVFLIPFFLQPGKKSQVCRLFILPPIVLLLAYAHISDAFLAASRLPEGWHDRLASIGDIYFTFAFLFLPLLPFAFAGLFRLWKSRKLRLRLLCFAGLLLFPFVMSFLFPRPPFPRLFFPIFGLWLLIFCTGISVFTRRKSFFYKILLLLLTILWVPLESLIAEPVVLYCFGRYDDMTLPVCMTQGFQPHKTANLLNRRYRKGFDQFVYIDFDSDPPSLKFQLINMDFPEELILYDRPDFGKVQRLPADAIIVCSGPERLEQLKQKFNLQTNYRQAELAKDSLQQVFIPDYLTE